MPGDDPVESGRVGSASGGSSSSPRGRSSVSPCVHRITRSHSSNSIISTCRIDCGAAVPGIGGGTSGAGGGAMYYTNVGPKAGTILWRDGYGAIGVLAAPDRHLPIGTALSTGWGEGGAAVYRLTVQGVD